jgi:hypothetical protein
VEFVNPKELKPKAARQLVLDLQLRLLKVENCLDDISRAAEIAQFTRQYDVTNAFCNDATELLKDRLTLPEIEQGQTKYKILEGEISQETIDQIKSKQQAI